MSETLQLDRIEVPITALASPHLPLILADTKFLATLKEVEAQTRGLTVIKDTIGAQSAANLLQRATKAATDLNRQRLDLIRPFQEVIDSINAAAKGPSGRLDAVKGSLKVSQTNFTNEQRRLAQEAEVKRIAELKRLEAIRQGEEKAAKEKAEKLAEQVRLQQEAKAKEARKGGVVVAPAPVVDDFMEEFVEEPPPKTETEVAIEALKYAPAPVVIKAAGVKEVVSLYPYVVDIELVPSMFVTKTIKLSALQSTFCRSFRDGDKLPECPGIRFEIQKSVQSTGRPSF